MRGAQGGASVARRLGSRDFSIRKKAALLKSALAGEGEGMRGVASASAGSRSVFPPAEGWFGNGAVVAIRPSPVVSSHCGLFRGDAAVFRGRQLLFTFR